MEILVTGATGFVGSHLCRSLLLSGHDVAIIKREDSSLDNLTDISKDLSIYTYDGTIDSLASALKDHNTTTVLHLASLFIAEHSADQIDSLIASNISFGVHLLEAMKCAGVNKIVNTGTSWQHFNGAAYNPTSLYAATKQAFIDLQEYYVRAEGFSAINLLLFDTYGEDDKRPKLINSLHQFADQGKALDISPGEQQLNLVHISDVCSAFSVAISHLNSGRYCDNSSYMVRTKKCYSLRRVIEIFEEITGKQLSINWGGREYRKREVMIPYSEGVMLPDWSAEITIQKGLSQYK